MSRSGRLWRWAAAVWTVTVVVGGALTLMLDGAGESTQGHPDRPGSAPSQISDERLREVCPTRDADREAVLCAYQVEER